jgi:hypothetical protein
LPFPLDLPQDRQIWLAHEVRRLRRERLLRHLARAIAADIHRATPNTEEKI